MAIYRKKMSDDWRWNVRDWKDEIIKRRIWPRAPTTDEFDAFDALEQAIRVHDRRRIGDRGDCRGPRLKGE